MVNYIKRNWFYKSGIILVIVSSFMIISNRVLIIKKISTENKIIESIIETDDKKVNNYNNNYVGILDIPKINLKKGLVNVSSKYNNVNKNIQVISSDISNIETESIILAAHSGSGYKAFFKNLHKLEIDDLASIYYAGKKYNYIVTDIFTELKDGDIELPKDNNLLILTTCYNKEKQLVVILEKVYDIIERHHVE